MRALWRGVIEVAGKEFPVKLYAAVQPHAQVSFTLLHSKDLTPLKQVMVNSETGEPVPKEEIVKGYPLSKRRFVAVDPAEIAKLAPEGDRSIEVLALVDQLHIDPRYYVRPYYVGPDTHAEKQVATLHRALSDSGMAAIVRWVMRKVRYHGALAAEGAALVLNTLRQPEQVLHREQSHAGVELDQREIKTADYLVEALSGEFRPEQYRDEYRERVEELIARKARGLPVAQAAPKQARTSSGQLLELLEESLKSAKQERGTGAKQERQKGA
jgi:DNA end-binding protein Ku